MHNNYVNIDEQNHQIRNGKISNLKYFHTFYSWIKIALPFLPGGFTEDPPADPPDVVGAEAAGAGVAADLEAIFFFFFNFFWMFYYDLSSRTVLRWMKDCKRVGIPIKKV